MLELMFMWPQHELIKMVYDENWAGWGKVGKLVQDEQLFREVCCVAAGMSALPCANVEKELQDTVAHTTETQHLTFCFHSLCCVMLLFLHLRDATKLSCSDPLKHENKQHPAKKQFLLR